MTYILNIETTTKSCSVVLSFNNEIIALKESQSTYTHSENITLFISEVIKIAGISLKNIDAIAISKGPGSYMGLRIGVSTAKGLCYAIDRPLIAIDTLSAMALKVSTLKNEEKVLFCPMIDARRMEVYCALFDNNNICIVPVEAKIINQNSFDKELTLSPVYFFGDGASKCKEVFFNNKNAFFLDDYIMSADALVPLAFKKYNSNQFENLSYFEPFYLKDFIPGISNVKGLK